ncbi:MAG: hypothetical protein ACI4RM_06355 [Ruminococcus sp.]
MNVFFNNNQTLRLEWAIEECNTFEDFEKRFSSDFLNEDRQLSNCLNSIIFNHQKTDVALTTLSVLAGQNKSYLGNVINGVKKNPSRDVLLCFAFALDATFDETQSLLKCSGHQPLYVRRKRDVIIWFCLKKGQSLGDVNEELISRGFKPLCIPKE